MYKMYFFIISETSSAYPTLAYCKTRALAVHTTPMFNISATAHHINSWSVDIAAGETQAERVISFLCCMSFFAMKRRIENIKVDDDALNSLILKTAEISSRCTVLDSLFLKNLHFLR
jgi:hypothetical protein